MSLPAPITTANAPLPQTYEAAKAALAQCTSVDECQDWADKAAALASYARQQDDDTLEMYARRIRARATRRVGELLKQFDARGDNKKAESAHADTFFPPSQREVAASAGLSVKRQVTAVRVANIPEEEFNTVVESPVVPSITKLAEAGKRVVEETRPTGFHEATHTVGAMRRFVEKCREHAPELVATGVMSHEAAEVREMVAVLDHWLDRFVVNLRG